MYHKPTLSQSVDGQSDESKDSVTIERLTLLCASHGLAQSRVNDLFIDRHAAAVASRYLGCVFMILLLSFIIARSTRIIILQIDPRAIIPRRVYTVIGCIVKLILRSVMVALRFANDALGLS